MILKELQNFVLEYHRVSLAEMELHFHMDGDALRQMLKKLVQKGRVRQLPIPEHCEGCTFCNPDTIEFYEWIDETDDQNSDSCQLPKTSLTKAQIHSTNVSEEETSHSEQTGIKYAVILHDCKTNH
jgi:hypothetical protein